MRLQVERTYRLIVGDSSTGDALEIEPPLNIKFKIEKHIDNSKKLNLATFEVFNLSKETRTRFENMKYPYISFSCGYIQSKNVTTIFIGQATSVSSKMNGADVVTTIEACEGFVQLHTVIEPFTTPQSTTVGEVLERIVKQMQNISLGTTSTNFSNKLQKAILEKGYKTKQLEKKLSTAFPAEGTPIRLFKELCKQHQIQWRLDKDAIYFRNSSGSFESPSQDVVSFTETTGLIGLPAYKDYRAGGSLQDFTGMVGISFSALLNPEVSVATLVDVQSQTTQISGIYFIRHILYKGEYRGSEWAIHVEADEVKKSNA